MRYLAHHKKAGKSVLGLVVVAGVMLTGSGCDGLSEWIEKTSTRNRKKSPTERWMEDALAEAKRSSSTPTTTSTASNESQAVKAAASTEVVDTRRCIDPLVEARDGFDPSDELNQVSVTRCELGEGKKMLLATNTMMCGSRGCSGRLYIDSGDGCHQLLADDVLDAKPGLEARLGVLDIKARILQEQGWTESSFAFTGSEYVLHSSKACLREGLAGPSDPVSCKPVETRTYGVPDGTRTVNPKKHSNGLPRCTVGK